jgi:pyrroline-5-carboxylate reductase
MNKPKAGILGAGRLGKALALRLREKCDVAIFDINAKLCKQFAKQNGLTFLYEEDLCLFADFLVLAIPSGAVEDVARRVEARLDGVSLLLNTATNTDTLELVNRLELRRARLVGFKPIGQFAAIQQGIRTVFVTANASSAEMELLSEVFSNIGPVRRGDEGVIQTLNREATRLALRFAQEFTGSMETIVADQEWISAALRNCAAGTLLDFPPDPSNVYTAALLPQIEREFVRSSTLSMGRQQ